MKTLSIVENRQTKVIDMCIGPVKVSFSRGYFIQEALVKKMQTSVRKITLNLNKLNYEISDPTIAIDGMQVPGAKDCYTLIKLPVTYTRKHDSLLTIKKLQHQTKLKNETT